MTKLAILLLASKSENGKNKCCHIKHNRLFTLPTNYNNYNEKKNIVFLLSKRQKDNINPIEEIERERESVIKREKIRREREREKKLKIKNKSPDS